VKHGDLRGFDPQEIEVIALITRYHRQAVPKKGHDGYGTLPRSLRRRVRALSAILRLAEGLDRSHSQPLAGVDVHDRGDDVLVQLRTSGDAELELWAAHRHVIPFEGMLGKPVRFEVRGTTPHVEHAH
jgi:exopolyphosphatase/guanosine-5'-triphosphate,3'-diphosphate pyrophosphatase